MSCWKKIIILLLITLIVTPGILPAIVFADPLTAVSGGVTTTACPPGQQKDASGKCAAITISPTTVTAPSASGPCSNLSGSAFTQCQNAQAAAPTLQQFHPNVNISLGNTYGGMSISGVGGAIASCTNVGSFLINGAINLLSKSAIGKKVNRAFGFVGGGNAVSTSDKPAQDQLAAQTKISQCLDGVAYAVAKNTLAQVTNKTLNWVNTGLNGNPLYVQNTQSYLGSIKNQQTTNFLSTVQTSDPIFGNALRSALTLQLTGKSDGLLTVSLNTPQAQNYNSFIGNFTNGGWNALLNPAYNPIGAFFNATDTLTGQINTAQQSASNEIQRNNGFLDLKHCTQTAPLPAGTDPASAAKIGLTAGTQPCTQWATDTPGSIIANQVATITTTPVRQLEYANKINEVLGNFFDSFVNNLMSKGLRGSGTNERVDFGLSAGGDNTVLNTTGGASNTSALGYQSAASGGISTGDFDISRPQQLRSILQTQYDFLNRTQDAQIALNRIIPTIGALDYCIPGPNPDWQTGTDSNWQTFLGSIQQANPKDPGTVEKLVGALPVVGGFLDSLVSLFTGSGTAPALWSGNGILSDKITGSNVQITRTFYAPSGHNDGTKTNDLENALNLAYQSLLDQYKYYTFTNNTFVGTKVGNAFEQAAANDPDPSYVDGFLQDSYTATDSIVGYNQAATTIDQQYDQNISDTQNDIKQLEAIRQQVNTIVATAKARYIKQRADAGDPVNMQCIDQAYQIDNSPITSVARQEPQGTALSNEEDAMVQHATDSANYFYSNEIK